MTSDPSDEGGDPACWLHLFEDGSEEGDPGEGGSEGDPAEGGSEGASPPGAPPDEPGPGGAGVGG